VIRHEKKLQEATGDLKAQFKYDVLIQMSTGEQQLQNLEVF
jgi:hypothetical protein